MEDKSNNKIFKIKLAVFLFFCLIVPVGYMAIRFGLFEVETTLEHTSVKINFVSVVAIAMLLGACAILIKYYIEGMKTKYSLLKQILEGFTKLILPLGLILVILILLGDNIYALKECMYVIIPSEMIAIVVNPLPKWCFDNNVEGLGKIFDKITGGKEGGK